MALIWADNFEMYGTIDNLLDGVYGSVASDFGITSLEGTPGNRYLRCRGASAIATNILYPLPAAKTEVGQGFFLYLERIPPNDSMNTKFGAYYTNSTELIYFRVLPTGQISVIYNGTTLATTTTPVVTAAADIHIESKIKISTTEGRIELRVRGRTVLLLENIDTGSVAITRLGHHNRASGIGDDATYRIKHWTMHDSLGAVNNDFLGQVMVYWGKTVVDISAGGWVSSAGAPVSETLNKPSWANQLTASGNIVNSDTVRVDNTYYRWTSGSVATGAGTSANPWLVALGVDTATSLQNMYKAINATGVPGTTYTPSLVEHPLVKGFGIVEDGFCVIPKVEGTVSMTFSETGAATSWYSTTQFTYLVWNRIRMSAGYTPAVKATGSLTFSGNPLENDTVTVGGTSFTFKASPTGPTDVAIDGSPSVTASNLATAIGLNVSTVTAEAIGLVVDITAVSAGALGNTISLASTSAEITTSDSTLEGGEDVTYPDPFEVGLTPLPDDVTSIRAVIPVVRAAKLDGGDGNIQVSFGTLNTNYDVGPDTPITNAMTYWGNATDPFVSEINPDTGTPWTPGEFNLGARVRVARTK